MTNIKNKIITFISIYKIINKIKKSKYSALKIGTELSHFGYYLYINILNDDTDFSNELDNKNIYEIFKHNVEFEHYIIMGITIYRLMSVGGICTTNSNMKP